MSTRFYLTNDTTDYTPSGSSGNWNVTTGAVVKALSRTKLGASTSKGTTETSSTANWDVLLGRWVSDPIRTAGTLEGAVTAAVAGLASSTASGMLLRLVVYVEALDGTVRGEALDVFSSALGTSAAGRSLSGTATSVSCEQFDRIVVEVGYTVVTNSFTNYTGTAYYGGTDATDMSASDTTTTHPAWVEFADAGVAALFVGAAPSLPEFVGIGSANDTIDSTSHSVPIPTGDDGDLLVLFVATGSGSAAISANNSFAALGSEVGDTMQARTFVKVADGSESANVTVTLSTSYTIVAACVRYRHIDTSGSPIYRDGGYDAPATASSTAPAMYSLTGTEPTDMVVGAWLSQDSSKGAVTPSQFSGGWTVRDSGGHPAGSSKDTCGFLVLDKLGGTGTPVVTDGNSNSKWVVFDLSFPMDPTVSQELLGDLLSFFGI